MIQDIITYGIVLYASGYALYHSVMVFIPKRKAAAGPACSSCIGCGCSRECEG